MTRIVMISLLMLFVISGCGSVGSSTGVADEGATPNQDGSILPGEQTPTPVAAFKSDLIAPAEHKTFSYESSSGEIIEYWLYLPEEYSNGTSWPLIIFLHGYIGNDPDVTSVRAQTPPELIGAGVDLPFIVLSPYLSEGQWPQKFDLLDELIAHLSTSLSVDGEAQFLAGLSFSTQPVWKWALDAPERFAGIVLVAGTASLEATTEAVCGVSELPIWIAHGELDDLSIASHRAAATALESCGSTSFHFTAYADLDHWGTIERAFSGPELYEWMIGLRD